MPVAGHIAEAQPMGGLAQGAVQVTGRGLQIHYR